MSLESRLDMLAKGWRGPLVAAVIAFLAGLPGVMAMPPLDRDESRFAQATAQMLETGDYVSINFQDRSRDKKPIGIHWFQAMAVAAVSNVEDRDIWPYRIPSLLGAMLAAAACVWGARAFWGDRTALLAGAMLAASFLLSTEAFIAKTDAMLAGCITLAMAALARLYGAWRGTNTAGWRTVLLLWLGVAFGVLVKGPVILMVLFLTLGLLLVFEPFGAALQRLIAFLRGRAPAGSTGRLLPWAAVLFGVALEVVLAFGGVGPPLAGPLGLAAPLLIVGGLVGAILLEARDRDPRWPDWAWIREIRWGWGLVLILAVFGPWALAISVATDGAFWGAAIGGDLAPKLAGGHERHGGVFGYHALLSPFTLFPYGLLIPAALALAWKQRDEPGVRFALCWLIPTWLAFEILPTKLFHYSLPTHAAVFWLMAAALREPLSRLVGILGAAAAALAGLVFTIVVTALMVMYGDAPDLAWAILTGAAFLGAGIAGAVLLLRRRAMAATLAAGFVGVLAHGLFFGQFAPRLEPFWPAPRIAMALERTGLAPKVGRTPGPVEVAGYSEASLVFALGTRTGLGGPEDAVRALAEGRPAIVEKREQAEFLALMAAEGVKVEPVVRLEALNYSNGDDMDLTFYRGVPRATDLTRQPAAATPGARDAATPRQQEEDAE